MSLSSTQIIASFWTSERAKERFIMSLALSPRGSREWRTSSLSGNFLFNQCALLQGHRMDASICKNSVSEIAHISHLTNDNHFLTPISNDQKVLINSI